MTGDEREFETLQVHAGYTPDATHSRVTPLYQTTAYTFDSAEHGADLFALRESGNIYTRLQNPTTDMLEKRVAALEGGPAALAVSSGHSAQLVALTSILSPGDNFVSSPYLYGGTHNQFKIVLRNFGLECRFAPDNDPQHMESLIDPRTRAIYVETIGNPSFAVPDFGALAALARRYDLPLIVDNTFPTPVNCRPFQYGVDIVTHATTKYMDGHGSCVGGAIVDSGNFDWMAHAEKFPGLTTPDDSYHGVTYAKDFGKAAYITKATAQLMRDFGSTPAPINSWIMGMHLESLGVRMERHCANALKVAQWLSADPRISWVSFPGLEEDKYHALAEKYMPNGTCGVISFGVPGGREKVSAFLDHLKMVSIATHVADARSCTLYPAGTTHRQLTEEQLVEAGVGIDLVRLSCGIENADDIITDLDQALAAVQ